VTTFLEARRLVASFPGGPELRFLLALSGNGEPFRLYLEAAGAQLGRAARPSFLPFNTLHQHLAAPAGDVLEAYLLLPWDLCPEGDWRSGVPATRLTIEAAVGRAATVGRLIESRPAGRSFYLPAPLPPLTGTEEGDRELALTLEAIAARSGAEVLPADAFAFGSYFASGCPVGGSAMGETAARIVGALVSAPRRAGKVLVTDLDNTLWAGVIAEDGPDGISWRPEGAGYRHFVYQTFLKRLRGEGVLLAGVSRNDPRVVQPPFESGRMPLHKDDFVALLASYHAKSAQLRRLATELNLSLEDFVFVDDNPVELEEVRRALPEVKVIPFPTRDDGLPALLNHLSSRFARPDLTNEDRDRTAMYRRRLEGMAPTDATGADLSEFLSGLGMRLQVHDRTQGDRTRAVQLINKTNQFNANGRRWTDDEVGAVLRAGGRLYGATLSDRTGSHGEVIACLVDGEGTVTAFVMSCRVFQRRAEHAFLGALIRAGRAPVRLLFSRTERNEPFATFLHSPGFAEAEPGTWTFAAQEFLDAHGAELGLIEAVWD